MAVVVVARLIAVFRGIRAAGGDPAQKSACAAEKCVCGGLGADLRCGGNNAGECPFDALRPVKGFLRCDCRKRVYEPEKIRTAKRSLIARACR